MSETKSPDPAMIDEQWSGYDFRAAIPIFVFAILLTLALLAGRLFFNDLTDALVTFVIVLVLWPALLFVAIYRSVTYTYRITNSALLVDLGFLDSPMLPFRYAEIAKVEHGASWLSARLDIGWVRITTADGRIVKLLALRAPAAFADQIRQRIAATV